MAADNHMPGSWIAVTDRLPEEEQGTVAVLIHGGDILTAWPTYWHGAQTGFNCWSFPYPEEDAEVTHWCPLPPAPTLR